MAFSKGRGRFPQNVQLLHNATQQHASVAGSLGSVPVEGLSLTEDEEELLILAAGRFRTAVRQIHVHDIFTCEVYDLCKVFMAVVYFARYHYSLFQPHLLVSCLQRVSELSQHFTGAQAAFLTLELKKYSLIIKSEEDIDTQRKLFLKDAKDTAVALYQPLQGDVPSLELHEIKNILDAHAHLCCHNTQLHNALLEKSLTRIFPESKTAMMVEGDTVSVIFESIA
eukprot:gene24282-1550_t